MISDYNKSNLKMQLTLKHNSLLEGNQKKTNLNEKLKKIINT